MTRGNLAIALRGRGKFEAAEAEYRQANADLEKLLDPDHPSVAQARTELADLLLERGKSEEALRLAERAWSRRQRADIPDAQRADTAIVVAEALWATSSAAEDRARAHELAEHALELYERVGDAHEEQAADVRAWLLEHR